MKKQNVSFNAITTSDRTSNSTDDTFSSLTAGAGETPSAPAGAGVNRGNSPAADNGSSKIEKAKAEILAALEENGVDTGAFTLELKQFIDEEHRDVLWYGGVIAVVSYKGYIFSLEAKGEVAARLLHPWTLEVEAECYDKTESGGFYADMQKYIISDADLQEKHQELLYLKNNNWLEIFVQRPNGNWMTQTWLTNDDDICAGIIEMIETMDEVLEDEESASCELRIFETAIDFARRWGFQEKDYYSSGIYVAHLAKKAEYMRNIPSDELAAMMNKWARERLAATTKQETAEDFFFSKLEELFRKEGL